MSEKQTDWIGSIVALLPKSWRYQLKRFLWAFEVGTPYPYDKDGKPLEGSLGQ
jgi:hypothetical protein